jgi:hypothetical protein
MLWDGQEACWSGDDSSHDEGWSEVMMESMTGEGDTDCRYVSCKSNIREWLRYERHYLLN